MHDAERTDTPPRRYNLPEADVTAMRAAVLAGPPMTADELDRVSVLLAAVAVDRRERAAGLR
jgi:hypothetical protein